MSGEAGGGDAAAPVDELLVGEVHFPLEGGVPRVTTPSVPLAPGVSKQLMSRGLGEQPTRDCKCFVHFQAWTASTGEEVENTREGREASQIIVSKDAPHRAGLGTALLSMRPGERALVRVGSGGAYGAGGNFSFPAVAPHSDLLYDVHLLAVQRAETHAVRARGDMLWEERMVEAGRCRDAGNAALASGDACTALTQYVMGMSYIDDSMMAQLLGRYLDESTELKCALQLNAAAAALSLQRYEDALAHACAALAMQPDSVKALYRKGRAHAALGQDEQARSALQRAQQLQPGDAAIRAALRGLDAEESAKDAARRSVFGGLFGAAPPARGSQQPASPTVERAQAPTQQASVAPAGALQRLRGWWRGAAEPA